VIVTPNKDSAANCRAVAAALAVCGLIALNAGMALAQNSPPPAAPPAAPQAAPPPAGLNLPPQPAPPPPLGSPSPATEKHGFLNDFGQWWDKSVSDFKAKMQDQQTKLDAFNKQSADAAKDAATATGQAMKDAADAMVRVSHVIEIQETCPVAGNGAADCATAATNVCKGKGYTTGQPLDVRTAEKCAASLWVSGQAPTSAADCPVETTLLRVACQ
jgi:hypothetical protein